VEASEASLQEGGTEEALFVRAFVAVGLTDEVRTALVDAVERLRPSLARVTWVPAVNLHLSLVFLGTVPVARIADMESVVGTAVCGVSPMAASVSAIGTFGSVRSPRVVWAGVDPVPALIGMQARMVKGFGALGLRLEARPFRPHITLGRVKGPSGCDDLLRRIERIASSSFGVLPVGEVLLMRSELRPDRAVYSPIRGIPLCGA
jgi:2'-5' RNA ligase